MAISTVNQSELSDKLRQIGALMAMTYGGGHEAFEGLLPSVRDNYLWTVASLVNTCITLVDAE